MKKSGYFILSFCFILFSMLTGCYTSEVDSTLNGIKNEGTIRVSRIETKLSSGAAGNTAISDTLKVISNVDWTLINGSPSLFTVQEITPRSDSTIILIATRPNTSQQDKIGEIIIYGKGVDPVKITVTQEKGIRLTSVAGSNTSGFKDSNLTLAEFDNIVAMTYDQVRNSLYVADHNNFSIRKIDFESRNVTTLPGTFGNLNGVCSDVFGNIYLGGSNLLFSKISQEGAVTNLNWEAGDFGILSSTSYSNGPIYFINGNRIKKVYNSVETTLAGEVLDGFEDGLASKAKFNYPMGISVSKNNESVYVSDSRNTRIREINSLGIVTTLVGADQSEYKDGNLMEARLFAPSGIDCTNDGTVYFIDGGEVRKISKDRKSVRTIEFIGDELPSDAFTSIHVSGTKIFLSTPYKIYQFDIE